MTSLCTVEVSKGKFQLMQIMGILGMYFDTVVEGGASNLQLGLNTKIGIVQKV